MTPNLTVSDEIRMRAIIEARARAKRDDLIGENWTVGSPLLYAILLEAEAARYERDRNAIKLKVMGEELERVVNERNLGSKY